MIPKFVKLVFYNDGSVEVYRKYSWFSQDPFLYDIGAKGFISPIRFRDFDSAIAEVWRKIANLKLTVDHNTVDRVVDYTLDP